MKKLLRFTEGLSLKPPHLREISTQNSQNWASPFQRTDAKFNI